MHVAAGLMRSSDRDGRVKPGHDTDTARSTDRPLTSALSPHAGRGRSAAGEGVFYSAASRTGACAMASAPAAIALTMLW